MNKAIGETLPQLEASFQGELITQKDSAYDEVRAIYNGMIDKRPQLIAKCTNTEDVIAAVKFGRENQLDTAIRCGGHNGPGLSLVDDGLVIDLSEMKGIKVNPDTKTVQVEGGCTWGDVDKATHEHGMATVSGIMSTTGVGGLTLGGGHGYLTRKYGLTIDNLVGAEVVLANGELVRANKDENADLYWALRGGGGNFGVVTTFEYKLHPVHTVIAGPMFWPIDQLEKTLRWYREWLPNAPEDVYAFYLTAEVPAGDPFPKELHGKKVCGLLWCFTSSEDETKPFLQEARDVAKPILELVGPLPYPTLQSMFDELYAPGLQWYWKGDLIREIPDEAIQKHAEFSEVPSMHSTMHLYPVDGAAHRVEKEETTWNHRDANWSMVIAGVDPDPANKDVISNWAKKYWEAVHPYTLGGAYINFMMEEGQDRIKATYGDNYSRLQKIKAKYDPDNFFHVNQNIQPA